MIDIYGQTYSDPTDITFVIAKVGVEEYAINFGSSQNIYESDEDLLEILTALCADSYFKIPTENNNSSQNLTIETIYYSCLNLEVGNSFTFSTNKQILRANLEIAFPDYLTDPYIFVSKDDAELNFEGTLPNGGVNFYVNGVEIMNFNDYNMIVQTLLENTLEEFGDIYLPITYNIVSDFGYEFGTFTIESFNEYADTSQVFGTELQVTCDDYDIDNPDEFNRDRFLDDIDFVTTNAPTPEYTAQSYHLAEVVVQGVTYPAIVYGNIPNGIRIDSGFAKNKPVLNAIWNHGKYYNGESEREEFDADKARYKITLFYI
jgi:hypothetical protein